MQAHPVPQNIMQVEFQLVGNLTLRQFGYIAIGGIIAWAIFASPLLFIIRVPIAVSIALFGVALAFLPVNDMRLEKWIIAFFKAIYSPTRRVWQKQTVPVDFLTDRFSRLVSRPAVAHTTRADNRARLDLYLNTKRAEIKNNLDDLEDRKLQTLNFDVVAPAHLTAAPTLSPEVLPTQEPADLTPRIVAENKPVINRIASKVIFTPIATIKLPDRNIFVKQVGNKRRHSLNPKTANEGTILLPIRGERIFSVSQEIKQKLNRYVKPNPNQPPSARPEVLMREAPLPTPPQPSITPAMMPNALASKPVETPRPSAPTFANSQIPQVAPTPPTTTPPAESRPIVNVFVAPPAPEIPKAPPPFENIETPKEPAIPNRPQPPVAPAVAPPLVVETKLPTPPPVPPLIETDDTNQSLRQNLQQLSSEESMLKGELERYKQQEKYLESQLSQSREQTANSSNDVKLKQLEDQIIKMQHEKEQAEQRAQKLEGLITQMSTTQPKPNLDKEIITPSAAAAPKPAQIHVVAPRRAEGKMAPPMTTVPNVINGVVKDANGLLLSETIIVVKDKNDEPVRALKTNKVGQFAISTALPNGTYLMEVEKEGYTFDYIEIKLTGEILAPIEIRSRGGGI